MENSMDPDAIKTTEEVTSAIASRVHGLFDIAKSARIHQEVIWKDNLQNFNGEYSPTTTFRKGGSEVFVNITQMKTMAAYSRIMAVMMPPSGFPWSIGPTPHPDLIKLGITPRAAQASLEISPEAKQMLSAAKGASDGMRNRIKDDLVETRWEEKFSRGALDLVTFGTMIFKGPMAAPPKPSIWMLKPDSVVDRLKGLFGLQLREKFQLVPDPANAYQPDLEWVSPFEFYPDPAAYAIEDAMWAIHRHAINKNQFQKLSENDDFNADEIDECLNAIPDGNWSAETWESNVDIINRRNASATMNHKYVVLEYWGFLSGKELQVAGQTIKDSDLNKMHLANVWVCGNHPIKVSISNRATGKLPFYVIPYEKVPYRIWGRGVPEKMADPQGIINAASRALVENMGITAGPQVVVDMNRIVDGTKVDEIIPWGIWPVKNMEGSSTPPVQFIDVPSKLNELKIVIDIFRNFVQEVTSMPDMASGFAGNEQHNRTSSGMAMLFGAADSYTRGVVFNIDNHLTKPMIRALYDWEMQYSPDISIKGDMQVDASGVQGLMNKEAVGQKMAEVLANIGQIPGGSSRVNMGEVLTEIFRSYDLMNEAMVYTEEEAAKIDAANKAQEVQQQAQLSQVQNLAKPKAETTRNDAILQALEKTLPGDPIYPIMYSKMLEGYGELDPMSLAALNMMKARSVLENRQFADAQELATIQQDIEMEAKLQGGQPNGPPQPGPSGPPEPGPSAPQGPLPQGSPSMAPDMAPQ